MTDKIVVLTTCGTENEAHAVAASLIEKRLAACVNVLPRVQSVYRWKGAVERSDEYLLIIKSSRALFSRIEAEIGKLHTYEVPEVIAIPIVAGSESYLDWIEREIGAA